MRNSRGISAEAEHYNTQIIVACSNITKERDDLLAALNALMPMGCEDDFTEEWAAAEAAIAKAEGR